MKASVLLTILTSASASLCCIVPILGIIGGSGSLVSTVSWLEPFRPFFIGGTVLLLGFAWYSSFKSNEKDDCGCEPAKKSFLQSRKFLGVVTLLSLLLLSFPSYSKFLMQNTPSQVTVADQDKNKKITLGVTGMTCASCEHHIESELIKLSGVSSVKASYANKSATVEFDPIKVDEAKIIAAINGTGYTVNNTPNLVQEKSKDSCCSKGTCTPGSCSSMPVVSVPNERSKNLKVLSSVDELKNAFNKETGKIKFVAILSSTCGWCLQGAQAVQKSVIEQMKSKDISVIIVWTNMLKTDDKENAYKAASMFKDPAIVQYFDADNKFGDMVAKKLNPKGEKAWDIYMFYDKETEWTKSVPRPFEYAHQLSESLHPWADNTKYFCGNDLTKRLTDITTSL
jgi:mercuric ion transport protein